MRCLHQKEEQMIVNVQASKLKNNVTITETKAKIVNLVYDPTDKTVEITSKLGDVLKVETLPWDQKIEITTTYRRTEHD